MEIGLIKLPNVFSGTSDFHTEVTHSLHMFAPHGMKGALGEIFEIHSALVYRWQVSRPQVDANRGVWPLQRITEDKCTLRAVRKTISVLGLNDSVSDCPAHGPGPSHRGGGITYRMGAGGTKR